MGETAKGTECDNDTHYTSISLTSFEVLVIFLFISPMIQGAGGGQKCEDSF